MDVRHYIYLVLWRVLALYLYCYRCLGCPGLSFPPNCSEQHHHHSCTLTTAVWKWLWWEHEGEMGHLPGRLLNDDAEGNYLEEEADVCSWDQIGVTTPFRAWHHQQGTRNIRRAPHIDTKDWHRSWPIVDRHWLIKAGVLTDIRLSDISLWILTLSVEMVISKKTQEWWEKGNISHHNPRNV